MNAGATSVAPSASAPVTSSRRPMRLVPAVRIFVIAPAQHRRRGAWRTRSSLRRSRWDGAGNDVAVVTLLDLVATIGDDGVGHRALPGALREGPGDLQRVALLGDHERHLGRLRRLLRLNLGVGRSLAPALVLRKLALRA